MWAAAISIPGLAKTPAYFTMSREEKMNHVLRQTVLVNTELAKKFTIRDSDVINLFPLFNGTWPFSTHFGMFVVQVEALGTPEQKDYWLPRSKSLEVIGCYAQTELGHGSDVQGLETTATFDPKTDEFVIHTPKLSAAKFWPGDLGKLANTAAVIARLIVKGKDHGVQTFVVPLRDSTTHASLPGRELGDIGSKHGYQNKDNGYALFTNVRVPRSALLAKYVSVDSDGTVRTRGNPKLAYFTMMFNRLFIIQEAHLYLARALTIALRYSTFRVQFRTGPNKTERKVIDYQQQQRRLVPYLSASFAYFFAYQEAVRLFEKIKQSVAKGDTSGLG